MLAAHASGRLRLHPPRDARNRATWRRPRTARHAERGDRGDRRPSQGDLRHHRMMRWRWRGYRDRDGRGRIGRGRRARQRRPLVYAETLGRLDKWAALTEQQAIAYGTTFLSL